MALYIDMGNSPDQVFADLTSLVTGGNLGEVNVPGYTDIVQVTYTSPGSDALSQRIKALVDHAGNVVVSAVPSTYVLPTGNLITANAGLTFADTTSAGEAVVRVVYDVGLCNGAGYWVDGQTGVHIQFPRAIILYHELSHAWHGINGTVAVPDAAEEQAAETDENVARSAKGEPLRLTTSHNGGCGAPAPVSTGPNPTTSGSSWQIHCFVVTAAYGSAAIEAVDALRLVRDMAVRALPVGHALFEDLYREYYSYSPEIARRMWCDDALREAYLIAVVDPLLQVYGTLLTVLHDWPDTAAVDATLTTAIGSAAATGPAPDGLATALVDALLTGSAPPGLVGGGVLVDDRLPLTAWAIVRPLRAYWQARLGRSRPPAELRERIVAWWLEQAADTTATPDALRERVDVVEGLLVEGSAAWQR
jgi:hypothetical protein